jgi:hypothetical protein
MNVTMPWTAPNGHNNVTHDKLEDVRNTLGREADHLAQVAAAFGREAGAQADATTRDLARDAQKQTNVAVSRLADVAAALGPTLAAMGRQRMQQASERAQSLGHELGKVRITTEPKRNGGQSTFVLVGGICAGVAAGAAVTYFYDAHNGWARREVLKARLARWWSTGRQAASQKIEDMRESASIGVDEPIVAADRVTTDTVSYESWPEGTRVPTV